jgi:hypothetical protein
MLLTSRLRNVITTNTSDRAERNCCRSSRFRAATRHRLELLEDRTLLSAVSFSAPANYDET